jgi:hypothetical protein
MSYQTVELLTQYIESVPRGDYYYSVNASPSVCGTAEPQSYSLKNSASVWLGMVEAADPFKELPACLWMVRLHVAPITNNTQ